MGNRLLALFAVGILTSVGHCGAQKPVTELNFESVRGDSPSFPNRPVAEGLLVRLPSSRDRAIYCINSKYPNNIYCDLSAEMPWVETGRYRIDELKLSYKDPDNPYSNCTAKFTVSKNITPLQFDYGSVSCSDSAVPPPMSSVLDLTAIELTKRRKDADFQECVTRFENAGQVGWEPGNRSLWFKYPIKFTLGFDRCFTPKRSGGLNQSMLMKLRD